MTVVLIAVGVFVVVLVVVFALSFDEDFGRFDQ
jgi:hypothetical protein